jgi:hypothetical protein
MNIEDVSKMQEVLNRYDHVVEIIQTLHHVSFDTVVLSGGGAHIDLHKRRIGLGLIREVSSCVLTHFVEKKIDLRFQLEELGINFTDKGDTDGEDERTESEKSS